MNALIASLKYSPGLAKEFFLLGSNLRSTGWDVHYVLARHYKKHLPPGEENSSFVTSSATGPQILHESLLGRLGKTRALRRLLERIRPDLTLVYNAHPLNPSLLRHSRHASPSGLRAIYLHEPYKPEKRSFGLAGSLMYSMVEAVQTRAIAQTNQIILPSAHAKDLFDEKYPDYRGETHLAPILLPDLLHLPQVERRFVSLVGTVNKSRGLGLFLRLVTLVARRGDCDLRFKIVTRFDISERLEHLGSAAIDLLEVETSDFVTDEQIASTVAASWAIFLPHKQVTQSGNVPVAFRAGTPIVARDLPGFRQHITHRHNGLLIPETAGELELLEGIRYVRANFQQLSDNARQTFIDVFSDARWCDYYSWLPDGACPDTATP